MTRSHLMTAILFRHLIFFSCLDFSNFYIFQLGYFFFLYLSINSSIGLSFLSLFHYYYYYYDSPSGFFFPWRFGLFIPSNIFRFFYCYYYDYYDDYFHWYYFSLWPCLPFSLFLPSSLSLSHSPSFLSLSHSLSLSLCSCFEITFSLLSEGRGFIFLIHLDIATDLCFKSSSPPSFFLIYIFFCQLISWIYFALSLSLSFFFIYFV